MVGQSADELLQLQRVGTPPSHMLEALAKRLVERVSSVTSRNGKSAMATRFTITAPCTRFRPTRCARECAVPSCASKHGWTELLRCALIITLWLWQPASHHNEPPSPSRP